MILNGVATNADPDTKHKLGKFNYRSATFADADVSDTAFSDISTVMVKFQKCHSDEYKIPNKKIEGPIYWDANYFRADFSGPDLSQISEMDMDRRCLMYCNPRETVPMCYENAEILEDCSRNMGFCVICQEWIGGA